MSKRDEGKVRRTRDSASGGPGKGIYRINGEIHFTAESASNAMPSCFDCKAASDDTSGTSVAKAATSPAVGTAHPEYAEAACEIDVKKAVSRVLSEREKLPPGEGEMPEDRAAFAKAVFARVDLVEAWTRQVNSKDEKIAQRALEKLDEIRYAAAGRNEEEQQGVEIEVPTSGNRGRG